MKPTTLVVTFLRKEFYDLGRRRLIFTIYLLLPFVLSVLPLVTVLGIRVSLESGIEDQEELESLLSSALEAIPELSDLDFEDAVTLYLLRQMSVILPMIPLILTTFSGAYSLIGEKTERTLEPLLATPLSDGQLLFAKIAALGLPAYGATLAGALVGMILTDLALYPQFGFLVLPTVNWLLTVFLLCPLVTLLGLLVTVWISARSTDVQSAQQLAGLLALPLVLFLVGAILKPLAFQSRGLAVVALMLGLLDLGLFFVVRGRFVREEILTRWR